MRGAPWNPQTAPTTFAMSERPTASRARASRRAPASTTAATAARSGASRSARAGKWALRPDESAMARSQAAKAAAAFALSETKATRCPATCRSRMAATASSPSSNATDARRATAWAATGLRPARSCSVTPSRRHVSTSSVAPGASRARSTSTPTGRVAPARGGARRAEVAPTRPPHRHLLSFREFCP